MFLSLNFFLSVYEYFWSDNFFLYLICMFFLFVPLAHNLLNEIKVMRQQLKTLIKWTNFSLNRLPISVDFLYPYFAITKFNFAEKLYFR